MQSSKHYYYTVVYYTVVCIVNPRHTCTARVAVVGLCVCLSVHGYSGTTGYGATYERCQRLQNNEILKK